MKTTTTLTLICGALALSSCYQEAEELADGNNSHVVTFDLSCSGIEQQTMTRALAEPVQLLIFDSCNGKVSTTEKESFSSVALPLVDGLHDLYFMAASKKCQSYDKDALTVTWPDNVSGYMSTVWAYHYQLNVSESTVFESIELPLVVADVKVNTLDNLPSNTGTITIEAPGVCTKLDLKTMSGVSAEGVKYSVKPQSGNIGKRISLNIYTLVPEDETVGDIAITIYDKTITTQEISSRVLTSVPVEAGFVSNYSGYFFSEGISIPLSHTQDWFGVNEYGF